MEEINLKTIDGMQNENTLAKGKSLKDRILEIDKNRTDKNVLSDLDKENLEKNKILKQKVGLIIQIILGFLFHVKLWEFTIFFIFRQRLKLKPDMMLLKT